MYKCECGNDLIESKNNKNQFICMSCFSTYSREQLSNNLKWTEVVIKDKEAWFFCKAFEEYPFVIAHEYWRVCDLLEQGQTYGALMQIKDIFEVILKFYVLVAASEIFSKENADINNNEKNILVKLIDKRLSLGDWKSIGDQLGNKKIRVNRTIKKVLNEVVKIYNDSSLVAWRNETIGHGALGFDSSREFIEKFKEHLIILKDHFYNNYDSYSQIALKGVTDDGYKDLMGKNALYTNDIICNRFEIIVNNHIVIELIPYIMLIDKGMYFFDSYDYFDEITYYLNYPEGKKNQGIEDIKCEIIRKYEFMDKSYKLTLSNSDNSAESKVYFEEEEKILEGIMISKYMLPPTYLIDKVNEIFKQKEKGVILLQMESGMGKTTFATFLDELNSYRDNSSLENFIIKSYYINDINNYRVDDFERKVIDILRSYKSNKTFKTIKVGFPIFRNDENNKAEEFARVLKKFKEIYMQVNNRGIEEKLVFIIDGLDEIPNKEDISIFNYIPTDDMLDEGIYVILTCRTNNEISNSLFLRDKMDELLIKVGNSRIEITNIDKKYEEVLKEYIYKFILNDKNDKDLIENLLSISQRKFLYLKLLREIYNFEENFNSIHAGEDLLEYYINRVGRVHGKYYKQFISTLLIVSLSEEPLTTKELSYFLNENEITFKFLAYLSDLKPMLKSERSNRGNILYIANEKWKNDLLHNNKHLDTISYLIKSWIGRVDGFCKKYLEYANKNLNIFVEKENQLKLNKDEVYEKFDGMTYLLSNIYFIICRFEKHIQNYNLININFANFLSNVANDIDSSKKYLLERKIKMFKTAILIYKGIDKEINRENLIQLYIDRGKVYTQLLKYEYALKDYDSAFELVDKENNKEKEYLIDIYQLKSESYYLMSNFTDSIKNITDSINLLESLTTEGAYYTKRLINILSNRCSIYHSIHENSLASADLEKLKTKIKVLEDNGIVMDEIDILYVKKIEASLLEAAGKFKSAIELYSKCINNLENRINSMTMDDIKVLLELQKSRGRVYLMLTYHNIKARIEKSLTNARKAIDAGIKDITKTIDKIEELNRKGILLDLNFYLLDALKNRAELYKFKGDYPSSKRDYERVLKIKRSENTQNGLPENNDCENILEKLNKIDNKIAKRK